MHPSQTTETMPSNTKKGFSRLCDTNHIYGKILCRLYGKDPGQRSRSSSSRQSKYQEDSGQVWYLLHFGVYHTTHKSQTKFQWSLLNSSAENQKHISQSRAAHRPRFHKQPSWSPESASTTKTYQQCVTLSRCSCISCDTETSCAFYGSKINVCFNVFGPRGGGDH